MIRFIATAALLGALALGSATPSVAWGNGYGYGYGHGRPLFNHRVIIIHRVYRPIMRGYYCPRY